MKTGLAASTLAANVAARVIVPSRRSLGFGIVSAAGSIGTFFAAPLGQMVMQAGGWRMAFGAFFIVSLFMLPMAFLAGRAFPASDARVLGYRIAVLDGRPRSEAGPTAPAHGLALASVSYD